MARRTTTFRHEDWDGGLNLVDRPTDLALSEGSLFQNCYGLPGSLHKRPGYAKYNSSSLGANPVHSAYRFYKKNGVDKYLVISYNGALKKGDDVAGTFADIKTGLNATAKFSFETWVQGDFLIATNGVDTPQKWTGTGNTSDLGGTPPKGKYVREHKNRIVFANLDTAPNRIHISANGNAEDYVVPATLDPLKAVTIDVPSTQGEQITGIARAFNNLAIFQERTVQLLQGSDPANYQVVRTDANVGCIAPRSIVETAYGPIFLARDGVHRFNGNIALPLTRKIAALFQPGHALSLNLSRLSQAEAGVYRNWYLLSVPEGSSTTNNRVYMLDLNTLGRDNPSWYGPWTIPAVAFSAWNGASDQGELYWGDPVNGFAYKLTPDIYTDVAAAIAMEYESPDFDLGLGEKRKRLFTSQAVAKANGNWNVDNQISVDGFAYSSIGNINLSSGSLWGTGVWGTMVWGATGTVTSPKLVIGKSGRRFRYKLLHSGVNQPVDIDDYFVEFKLEKR